MTSTRARLLSEARAKLSAEQLAAFDKPDGERTAAEHELARQAELTLTLLDSQVERGIGADDRPLYDALKKKLEAHRKVHARAAADLGLSRRRARRPKRSTCCR